MNFPGGHCPLEMPLLATGLTGINGPQVQPAEEYLPLRRMSDAALFTFAADMANLLAVESCSYEPVDSRLQDYISLLSLQCEREIMERNL